MRAFLYALAFCCALTGAVHAQGGMMPGPGTPHAALVVGGPCDLVTFKGWYGLRACGTANKTGTQKAVNIQRSSDSTTTDILILSSGDLDVATAITFCAATTCTVQKLYDQSGNGQDLPSPHGLILLPTGCTDVTKTYCLAGGLGYHNGTITSTLITYMEVVGAQYAAFATNQNWLATDAGANPPSMGNGPSSSNSIYCYSGAVLAATAANSSGHVVQCGFGTSGVTSVDNVDTTGSTGAPVSVTSFQFGNSFGGAGGSQNLYEAGFAASIPSSGARTAVCHDAYVYWGTGTSC